jgi:hypothetical protein
MPKLDNKIDSLYNESMNKKFLKTPASKINGFFLSEKTKHIAVQAKGNGANTGRSNSPFDPEGLDIMNPSGGLQRYDDEPGKPIATEYGLNVPSLGDPNVDAELEANYFFKIYDNTPLHFVVQRLSSGVEIVVMGVHYLMEPSFTVLFIAEAEKGDWKPVFPFDPALIEIDGLGGLHISEDPQPYVISQFGENLSAFATPGIEEELAANYHLTISNRIPWRIVVDQRLDGLQLLVAGRCYFLPRLCSCLVRQSELAFESETFDSDPYFRETTWEEEGGEEGGEEN